VVQPSVHMQTWNDVGGLFLQLFLYAKHNNENREERMTQKTYNGKNLILSYKSIMVIVSNLFGLTSVILQNWKRPCILWSWTDVTGSGNGHGIIIPPLMQINWGKAQASLPANSLNLNQCLIMRFSILVLFVPTHSALTF
jgi:hypothetical protein